jgi:hypothetical protein
VYFVEEYVDCVDVDAPAQALQEVYVVLRQLVGHCAKLGKFHAQDARMRQQIQYNLRFIKVGQQHIIKPNDSINRLHILTPNKQLQKQIKQLNLTDKTTLARNYSKISPLSM